MKRVYKTDTDITRLSGSRTRVKSGDLVIINTSKGQHILKAVPVYDGSWYRCTGCCFDVSRGCPKLTKAISWAEYPLGHTRKVITLCDEYLCTGSYDNNCTPRIIFKNMDDMLEDL